MLCGPPLHRCDRVSRRDWIDGAGRQGGEGQRKPDRVEYRDGQQAAGHLWVEGDDDIQRDQVKEPGDVGERARDGRGSNRELTVEPGFPADAGSIVIRSCTPLP